MQGKASEPCIKIVKASERQIKELSAVRLLQGVIWTGGHRVGGPKAVVSMLLGHAPLFSNSLKHIGHVYTFIYLSIPST